MRKLILLGAVALAAAGGGLAGSANSQYTGRRMPYDAFEALPKTKVEVPGGMLEIAFAPGNFDLPQVKLIDWAKRSARAVSIYYGHFPTKMARVLIVPVGGKGVEGGTAWGYRGAAIRLLVGTKSDEQDLTGDWKMVHEMVHLSLPDLPESESWLAEGVAVYVESIARVQAGDLTNAKIWGDFMRDMPKGLPQAGDRGLDYTPTWGRTYWGGALFCLLADVKIREATHNRAGLQQALRAVLDAGGNHEVDWPITRIFEAGDKATGTKVLMALYESMRAAPVMTDLDALWRQLGVKAAPGGVTFDDNASLAAIRRAITAEPGRTNVSLQ